MRFVVRCALLLVGCSSCVGLMFVGCCVLLADLLRAAVPLLSVICVSCVVARYVLFIDVVVLVFVVCY